MLEIGERKEEAWVDGGDWRLESVHVLRRAVRAVMRACGVCVVCASSSL